ncbi:SLAP domain-containing protein, partial [Microbacteriaceae bacterium K1510]|nr:SLAP domain-containing protein [Microbacteriaceae bacterium K1510]
VKLDDRAFARHRFDLSAVGEIPPYSSRPWEIFFPTESFLQDNFAFTRWKIEMNLGERVWPKFLHIDPQMEARMTERQKERLDEVAGSLPSMKPGEVSITGFDIGKTSDGRLVAALLFRNARQEVYDPKKLKVKIYDAANDLVASGGIDASSVKVMPGTARPWLIVFPANLLKKPDADLRKWALDVTE